MEAPALHPWVYKDLARLAKVGIVPTLAESVWLANLAKAAHTPPGQEPVKCHASPIVVRGTTFYPFHLRARYFFAQWCDVFEGDQLLSDGLYQFAHAHSKPGDNSLVAFAVADEVADAVKTWLRGREYDSADFPAITSALYAMDHDDSDDVPPVKQKDDDGPQSYVTLEERVAFLCSVFIGTTPDYWTIGVSAIESSKLAAAMCAKDGEGTWATSALRTRRIESYMNAVQWITQRGLAKNG
jgi:hypothetical protein